MDEQPDEQPEDAASSSSHGSPPPRGAGRGRRGGRGAARRGGMRRSLSFSPRRGAAGDVRRGAPGAGRGRGRGRGRPPAQPVDPVQLAVQAIDRMVANDEAFLRMEERRQASLEQLVEIQRQQTDLLARLTDAVIDLQRQ